MMVSMVLPVAVEGFFLGHAADEPFVARAARKLSVRMAPMTASLIAAAR